MLAVERVPRDEISSYGVIDVEPSTSLGDGIYQVTRPRREAAA